MTTETLAKVIAITGLIALLAFLAWRARRQGMRVKLALRKLPKTSIAALEPGQRVSVVGIARADKLTEAAGSGRPCILYTSRLEDTSTPSARDNAAMGVDFELEDDTGRVRVVGNGAIEADLIETFDSPHGRDISTAQFGASVINRAAHATRGRSWIAEGIVVPGQRIVVGGTVERAADGTLQLAGTVDAPLLVVAADRPSRTT